MQELTHFIYFLFIAAARLKVISVNNFYFCSSYSLNSYFVLEDTILLLNNKTKSQDYSWAFDVSINKEKSRTNQQTLSNAVLPNMMLPPLHLFTTPLSISHSLSLSLTHSPWDQLEIVYGVQTFSHYSLYWPLHTHAHTHTQKHRPDWEAFGWGCKKTVNWLEAW